MWDYTTLAAQVRAELPFDEGYLEAIYEQPSWKVNVAAVDAVWGAVLGEGLLSFLETPEGAMLPEAVRGLKAMGLSGAAKVLQRGVEAFGPMYPRPLEARLEADLDVGEADMEDVFDNLEDALFELGRSEAGGLKVALTAYVREHTAEG